MQSRRATRRRRSWKSPARRASGIPLTHRVLQLFSGKPPVATGWAAASTSVRATAEPMLNAWAAKLLGNPKKVRCTVEMLDGGGAVLETRKLLLSDLQLAPLDVVFGVEPLAGVGQVSEIEQRVLYQARLGSSGFPRRRACAVQHARPADLGAQELTLLDVLEQARRVRRLLTTARAADSGGPESAGAWRGRRRRISPS